MVRFCGVGIETALAASDALRCFTRPKLASKFRLRMSCLANLQSNEGQVYGFTLIESKSKGSIDSLTTKIFIAMGMRRRNFYVPRSLQNLRGFFAFLP